MHVQSRKAVEALRAGVPNRDAVSKLGTSQLRIEHRFLDSLAEVAGEHSQDRQLPGFVIVGKFGGGKSHLLEWLQHLALTQRFACSRVVISKETPLSDLHKVFRSAVASLRLPEQRGGLEEAALKLRPRSASYDQFSRRVISPDSRIDPLFQATLRLYETAGGDDELVHRIIDFWSGDRLSVADIRRALRERGMHTQFTLRSRTAKDLALPRFQFASDLIAGAGYLGWVILMDEVELVAKFSLLSRARSYASLGTLLGLVSGEAVPGLFTCASVSDDFDNPFRERDDRGTIPVRLAGRLSEAMLSSATAGMNALSPQAERRLVLEPQSEEALRETFATARRVYAEAYEWSPPEDSMRVGERSQTMREYVRAWITMWDLQRLDPSYQPDIETSSLHANLDEHPDFETSSEPDEDNGAAT